MNCCISIITHKDYLTGDDELSVLRALEVFRNRDIKIIIPNNISTEYYDNLKLKFKFEYIKVDKSWLSSYTSYNIMCMSNDFYSLFKDYDYMLIYQTDCWVFEDNLDYFMNLNYDYYGAPWPHENDTIGNGGFSLRKVQTIIELTKKYENDTKFGNEDLWFCHIHANEIKICDLENACNFAIEHLTPLYKTFIKTHPMGIHQNFLGIHWTKITDNIFK